MNPDLENPLLFLYNWIFPVQNGMDCHCYSSDLSIWLSVDPMSDKYPSLSSYVYCADNPVNRIDPDGEDDYKVDRKTGKITLLKRTDDEKDRLVAQKRNGVIKYKKDGSYKNSIEINKGVLDHMTVGEFSQKMDFGSGEAAKKQTLIVFNFLADHTDVEWSALGYNNNNSITTSYSSDNEPSVTRLINSINNTDINYFYHNHPGSNASSFPSQGRSGEGGNDVGLWNEIWGNNPKAVMGIRAWGITVQFELDLNEKKGYKSK